MDCVNHFFMFGTRPSSWLLWINNSDIGLLQTQISHQEGYEILLICSGGRVPEPCGEIVQASPRLHPTACNGPPPHAVSCRTKSRGTPARGRVVCGGMTPRGYLGLSRARHPNASTSITRGNN